MTIMLSDVAGYSPVNNRHKRFTACHIVCYVGQTFHFIANVHSIDKGFRVIITRGGEACLFWVGILKHSLMLDKRSRSGQQWQKKKKKKILHHFSANSKMITCLILHGHYLLKWLKRTIKKKGENFCAFSAHSRSHHPFPQTWQIRFKRYMR